MAATAIQGEIGTAKDLYRRLVKEFEGTVHAGIARQELDNILNPRDSRGPTTESQAPESEQTVTATVQRVVVTDLDVGDVR